MLRPTNFGWRDCLIYVLLTDKYTAASSIYLCVLRPARRLLRWKTALETECWSSRRGMHNTQRFVQERLRSQRYNRNYGSWSIAGWLVEEFDSNELKLPEYMMRWRLWCICCVGGWLVEKRYLSRQFSEQTLIFWVCCLREDCYCLRSLPAWKLWRLLKTVLKTAWLKTIAADNCFCKIKFGAW